MNERLRVRRPRLRACLRPYCQASVHALSLVFPPRRGADILEEMHGSGELKSLLQK